MPEDGVYSFYLESDDGSWVYIDNELAVDAAGCRYYSPGINGITKQYSKGYHYFVAHYTQALQGHAFMLYWSINSGMRTLIPENAFYYAPPYQFTMSYYMATYTTSSYIENITPILYDIGTATKYSIEPQLQGLIFNPETGQISGTPSVSTDGIDVTYTITAHVSGSTTYSVKFTFDSKEAVRPSGFRIGWAFGPNYILNTKDIILMPGWYFDLKLIATGSSIWKFTDYPNGVGIGGESYTLLTAGNFSGSCTKYYEMTKINVGSYSTSQSDMYRSNFYFNIGCLSSCPNKMVAIGLTSFGHSYQTTDYDFLMQLEQTDGTVVFGTNVYKNGRNSVIGGCVSPGQYRVTGKFTKVGSPPPYIEIYTDNVKFTTANAIGTIFSLMITAGSTICENDGTFGDTPIGQTSVVECKGQLGSMSRKCGYKNEKPQWEAIENTCRDPIAPTNLHYGVTKIKVAIKTPMTLTPSYTGDISSFNKGKDLPGQSELSSATGILTLSSTFATSQNEYTITGSYNTLSTSATIVIEFMNGFQTSPVVDFTLGIYNNYQFVRNIPSYVKFTFGQGVPTECSSDPKLPEGITISSSTITGKPLVVDSTLKTYTLTCSNDYSTTNKVILLSSVHDRPLNGLLATYSKYPGMTMGCNTIYNSFKTIGSVITIQKIDLNIQHPYQSLPNNWEGLTSDFLDSFSVTWRGYIYIDVQGIYFFGLNSNEGSWLYIDEALVINNGGCHEMKLVTADRLLNVGYYLLEISYFEITGGSGFEFLYKPPGETTFKEVPNTILYYVPTSSFMYNYTYASYLTNEPITPNQPILYDTSIISYKIDPKLPEGLSMNTNNGIISGTPIVHTNKVFLSFNVIGTLSNGVTISTKIYFNIIDFQAPYGLQIKPYGSQILSADDEVRVYVSYSLSVTFSAIGVGLSFTLSPALPAGFIFMSNTISGTCTQPFNDIYTVIASNEGGKTSRQFRFICSNTCPFGYEPLILSVDNHVSLINDYTIKVIDSRGNTAMSVTRPPSYNTIPKFYNCIFGNSAFNYSGSHRNLLTMKLSFFILSQKLKEILTPVGAVGQAVQFDGSIEYTLTAGTIAYKISEAVGYYPLKVFLEPTITGLVTQYEIDPPLPNGVTIDQNSFIISGTINQKIAQQAYTIRYGTSFDNNKQAVINIKVDDCFDISQVPFVGVYTIHAEQSSIIGWKLQVGGTDAIVSNPDNIPGNTYIYSKCITPGTFVLVMTDESGFAWNTGTSLTLTISNIELGSYLKTKGSFIDPQVTETLPLAVKFAIDPVSSWSYSLTELPGTWYTVGFGESGMQKGGLSSIYSFTGNTIYAKRNIESVPRGDQETIAFTIYLQHKEGCIVYINDHEIYRRFLPSSGVTYSTFANDQFSQLTTVELFVSRSILTESGGVIAIEYHRHPSSSNFQTLVTSFFETSKLDCISLLTLNGTIISSSGRSDPRYPISNAIDNNKKTTWVELVSQNPGTTPSLQYYIGDNKYYWFDTYGIRSAYEATLDVMKNPTRVDFTVSNDFDEIEFPQLVFSIESDNQRQVGKYYDNYKLFNIFELKISEHFNLNFDCKIADVIIDACHKLYCSGDNVYKSTESGKTAEAICEIGYTGIRTRFCNLGRYPSWDPPNESGCTPDKPANFMYPSPRYILFKDEKMTSDIVPSYISKLTVRFNVIPSLPKGLNFDINTGIITGVPTVKTDAILYNITAENSVGVSSTVFQLTIRRYECLQEAFWPPTERGENATIDCNGGYLGTRYRPCSYSTNPKWGLEDYKGCSAFRNWDNPNKNEIYLLGTVTIGMDEYLDDLFLDYLRKAINDDVGSTDLHSVLLAKDESGDITRQRVYKVNLLVVVTGDTRDFVTTSLAYFFNTTDLLSKFPSSYMMYSISYEFVRYIEYIGGPKTPTIAIVLSSVFGVILVGLIALCVFFRCRSRSARKRASVSISNKKGGSASKEGTASAKVKARSVKL